MPRGLITVAHTRAGHDNGGELVVRPRGFAWVWLDTSDEAQPLLEWSGAHEIVHLLIAGASGWPTWPDESTIGQRVAGEYLANRFAGQILAEAGLALPDTTYQAADVQWVMGMARHARRKAIALLDGDSEPRDLERVRESVRVLARDHAYALGRTAAVTDPAAAHLAHWLGVNIPLVARIVEPIRVAGQRLADDASLRDWAAFHQRVGGEVNAILEPVMEGLAAPRGLAA